MFNFWAAVANGVVIFKLKKSILTWENPSIYCLCIDALESGDTRSAAGGGGRYKQHNASGFIVTLWGLKVIR